MLTPALARVFWMMVEGFSEPFCTVFACNDASNWLRAGLVEALELVEVEEDDPSPESSCRW